MSSNQGQGYGQYNPYGQSGNPYSDQGNPYANESYASRPQPGPPQGSSYYTNPEQGQEQQQGRYEMSTMNGSDPNRLLNEIRDVDRAIDSLEQDLNHLMTLQDRHIDATDSSSTAATQEQAESFSDDTVKKYRSLTARIKKIKSDPESGNPRNAPQVGKVDRRLKTMINQFQQQNSAYSKKQQERIAREYRIVRPDASDAEVREATEDSSTQVFSQALINSDRRGQIQNTANNVNMRHQAILKIERQMIELAELFQDLEAAVIQQEPAVTQIEQRGEEVTDHVAKANTELDGAVKKARAARRKKFYCLGIVVLIIIIIAVVVAVAVTVTKK